jgi:hypothetical protein
VLLVLDHLQGTSALRERCATTGTVVMVVAVDMVVTSRQWLLSWLCATQTKSEEMPALDLQQYTA